MYVYVCLNRIKYLHSTLFPESFRDSILNDMAV